MLFSLPSLPREAGGRGVCSPPDQRKVQIFKGEISVALRRLSDYQMKNALLLEALRAVFRQQ